MTARLAHNQKVAGSSPAPATTLARAEHELRMQNLRVLVTLCPIEELGRITEAMRMEMGRCGEFGCFTVLFEEAR